MASLVVAGDVSGSVTLSAPSAAGSTVITLPTTSGTMVVTGGAQTVQFAAGSAASPSITFTGDTNTGIFSPTADTIGFSEGGVESMRITSTGNVGIGTNSPTSRLAVSYTSDASAPLTVSKAGVNFIGSSSVQLLFGSDPNSPYASYIQTSNGAGSSFPISLNPSGGNVGIGTINPVNILDIAGEGQSGVNAINFTWSTTSTGYAPVLNLKKSNGSKASPTAVSNGDQTGAIVFNGYDGSNYQSTAYIESRVDGTPGANDMPGRLVFFTTPDGSASPTERMRITSSGNLVMANRTGATVGQIQAGRTNNTGSVNGYITVAADSQDPFPIAIRGESTNQGFVGFFDSSNNEVGRIGKSGSNTTYVTSSDYRLKENIVPMTGALNKVSQLKPVTYTWKSDGSAGQGFIAHELQAVVPDCVSGEKDAVELVDIKDEEGNVIGQEEKPIYQGIDTSFLVATLTAAIQELNAKVEAQAAEIAALKGAN